MDIVIKNGTIVTDSDLFPADIAIQGEKIAAIAPNITPAQGSKVIDAAGCYVMPGGIDVHVHLQLPFCGSFSRDDFENGTKAGACGGLTSVIDFAIQSKGKTMMEAVEARRAEADPNVAIDYGLHVAITDWNERTRQELKSVIEYGIPTFKMFMIYQKQGWMAGDADLFQALEESAKWGGMVGVHAESVNLLDLLVERYSREKEKYGAYAHCLSRPNYIESEAIVRAITWAEATGGTLYIVHMSTKEGADAVKMARERGVKVYAETCPQYLLLQDEVFKGPTGHYYATCPQIKKQADSDRLWHGLKEQDVAVIATDTCTFDTKQKDMWQGDFTKMAFGLPGVETMLPLIFSEGVMKDRISLNRFVGLVSTNPAKLFGLYPEKGSLAPGTDADITIYDPNRKVTLQAKNLQTNCDWSPFEGWQLTGYPRYTLARGRIVAEEGKFVGEKGWGRFLKRHPGMPVR